MKTLSLGVLFGYVVAVAATWIEPAVLDACPGYAVQNVTHTSSSLTADLVLNGNGCAVFGPDVETLLLQVDYETGDLATLKPRNANSLQLHVFTSRSPTS